MPDNFFKFSTSRNILLASLQVSELLALPSTAPLRWRRSKFCTGLSKVDLVWFCWPMYKCSPIRFKTPFCYFWVCFWFVEFSHRLATYQQAVWSWLIALVYNWCWCVQYTYILKKKNNKLSRCFWFVEFSHRRSPNERCCVELPGRRCWIYKGAPRGTLSLLFA